jgi:hypothetical protein
MGSRRVHVCASWRLPFSCSQPCLQLKFGGHAYEHQKCLLISMTSIRRLTFNRRIKAVFQSIRAYNSRSSTNNDEDIMLVLLQTDKDNRRRFQGVSSPDRHTSFSSIYPGQSPSTRPMAEVTRRLF